MSEITILAQPQPFAIPASYGPGGSTGRAGQNVDSIGLLVDAAGMDTAGADLVRTSGNTAIDFGRGTYVKDSSVDLAAHPKAGFPNNTGQKYRITRDEAFNPQTQYEATDPDFQAAMERSLAYLEAEAVGSGFYKAGQPMRIPSHPAGPYALHDTLYLRHRLKIDGDGGQAGPGSYGPTAFTVPDGVHALVVEFPDSDGADAVTGTTHNGAHNAEISGIGFFGPASGTVSDFDTIVLRAPTDLTDIYGRGLQGGLVRMWTGNVDGVNYSGDCSNSNLDQVKAESCKFTASIRGTNSNVISTRNCQGYQNLQFALLDGNDAGANSHFNWHNTYNGIPAPTGGPYTQCSHSGNIFTPNMSALVSGTDFISYSAMQTLLNAHAPPTTAISNAWWVYVRAGGATSTQPLWSSTGPWIWGGDALSISPFSLMLYNMYSEGGGAMNQAVYRQTLWLGGTIDASNIFGGRHPHTTDDAYVIAGTGESNLMMDSGGGSVKIGARLLDGTTEFGYFLYQYGGHSISWVPSVLEHHVQSGASDIHVFDTAYPGIDLQTGKALSVNGNQVVGGRLSALPADATDLATAMALANAIKARLKTTGGHGLVAD